MDYVTERTIMATIIQRPRSVETRVPQAVYVVAAILMIVGIGLVMLRTWPLVGERSANTVPARPVTADVALTPTELPPQ
ncbi:MAG: hypothetical protein AAB921_00065 [Patescibacteria group bacterium]